MIRLLSWRIRKALMLLVRLYQATFSALLPSSCRFVPSCSDYALEVLQRKPLLGGLWLIARRLGRCHPFCRGGFDPVPPDRAKEPGQANSPSHN